MILEVYAYLESQGMKIKPLKRIKMSTDDIGDDHDPTQGGPVPIHHNNGDLRSDRPDLRLDGMTRETHQTATSRMRCLPNMNY